MAQFTKSGSRPIRPLPYLDALLLAQGEIHRRYGSEYDAAATIPSPLRLPDGWRFPFEFRVNSLRVRRTMVTLFVQDDKNVVVEADELARDQALMGWLNEQKEPERVALRPLKDIRVNKQVDIRAILSQPDSAWHLETTEAIYWRKGDAPYAVPYWRLGLVENGMRRHLLWLDQDGAIADQKHTSRSSGSIVNLGRSTLNLKNRKLSVNLRGLVDKRRHFPYRDLAYQWLVWNCMAHMAEVQEGLGYHGFQPRHIRMEFSDATNSLPGALYNRVDNIPTISFLRQRGWAADPSIVLHELGHALWEQLYAQPPQTIDTAQYTKQLDGIQEGLADFVAAMMLNPGNEPVVIGGSVELEGNNDYLLPRQIDGNLDTPNRLPVDWRTNQRVDEHLIGWKWANLLWYLRGCLIGQGDTSLDESRREKQADQVILNAHLRPRVSPSASSEPVLCYLEALVNEVQQAHFSGIDWGSIGQKVGVEKDFVPFQSHRTSKRLIEGGESMAA